MSSKENKIFSHNFSEGDLYKIQTYWTIEQRVKYFDKVIYNIKMNAWNVHSTVYGK